MIDQPTGPRESDAPAADAAIGHNQGPEIPPYNESALEKAAASVDAFIKESDKWLTVVIDDEEQEGLLVDQIAGLSGLFKKVDATRIKYKKPHDDAGKAVQAAFTPLLNRIDQAKKRLKPIMDIWLAKKRAAAEEEQKAKAEAARKLEEDAKRKAIDAENTGSIDAKIEAEAAEKAAEKAKKDADKKIDVSAKSASGAGRTIAARTTRSGEIFNQNLLYMHYKDRPEVGEVLQRLANADIRAAKGEKIDIPGVKVVESKAV